MPITLLPLAILAFLLFPMRDAHAYIDPGTGSFIIQMLIASILGSLFTIKLWIGSAKKFLRRLTGGDKKAGADSEAAPTPQSASVASKDEARPEDP